MTHNWGLHVQLQYNKPAHFDTSQQMHAHTKHTSRSFKALTASLQFYTIKQVGSTLVSPFNIQQGPASQRAKLVEVCRVKHGLECHWISVKHHRIAPQHKLCEVPQLAKRRQSTPGPRL